MSSRHPAQEQLACSFCHKSQEMVNKLISSPRDYPRAYICDECITACASILEDERGHPVFHPLTGEFFSLVDDWVSRHDRGEDVSEVLDRMLDIARQIVGPYKNEPTPSDT